MNSTKKKKTKQDRLEFHQEIGFPIARGLSKDNDCEVCSRPWQWATLRKPDRPSLVNSDWCITVKNTSGPRTVMFCACNIIHIFTSVFHVVRAVHTFDFRLVINETTNKWWPVDRKPCCHSDSYSWQDLYVFPRPSVQVLRDCTHAVQVKCFLLGNRHYIYQCHYSQRSLRTAHVTSWWPHIL